MAKSRAAVPSEAPSAAPTPAVDPTDARWAPFVRRDRYGTYGAKPQPLTEKLRIALGTLLMGPPRVVLILCCIVGLSLSTRWCQLVYTKGSRTRANAVAFWCRFWAGSGCGVLGWRRTWVTVPPMAEDAARRHGTVPPAGIVSNHVSWADILILEAEVNPSFVAKDGSQDMPLLGIVNLETQCIYVKRSTAKGAAAAGVSAAIKERTLRKAADPSVNERLVLTFPEGTCTNGRYLLPFKTGAFLAGAPLLPVLMVWDERDARRVSMAWDTIDFAWHFFLTLSTPQQYVTCYKLPVYVPDAAEQQDPVLYAKNMRNHMLKYSTLLPSEATYEDKKVMDSLPRSTFIK